MRIITLIALREYAENVKTKGFWLGVLLVPVVFASLFLFFIELAGSAPVRHFILVDQSNAYADDVETAIRREHQRRILQAFLRHVQQYRGDGFEAPPTDVSRNAESRIDGLLSDISGDEVAALDSWLDSGGLESALEMVRPYLRDDAPPFERPGQRFVEVPLPSSIAPQDNPARIVEQLRPYLTGERRLTINGDRVSLFALILIPDDVDNDILTPPLSPDALGEGREGPRGVQFWTSNLTDTRLPNAIRDSINHSIRDRALQERGIDPRTVRELQRSRMPLNRLDPTRAAGEEAVGMADTLRQWAPIGFVYLILISLMQSVQYLLSNTVEEKSNRIIEVLIASVTPNELMMGKLLGIGLSGITTIGAWIGSFFVFIRLYQTMETAMIAQILDVLLGSDLIPWFIFYYLAGYALYSGIFLAIGSLCNTLKEAQSLMVPLMLIMIIPVITMGFIAQDPNGTMARVMSWIPLFTPFTMMNRAAAQPPLVDLVGTTVLLLITVTLVLWLTGRVFRQGVLRSGQPPRLLEFWRMVRRQD